MKSQFFGTTVNGDACLKLVKDLKETEPHIFMKKHKIAAPNTYHAIIDTLQECYNNGIAYTFMSDVARVMKKYGFEITEPTGDTTNPITCVNYSIG